MADGKVELQKWWDSSEKKEQELDDVIDVSYTKVEVFYEYPAEEQQPAEADMGDANCDEKVDLNDAVAILQYAALPAKYPLTDQGMLNADVIDNGTSGVNGVDALAVQMVDAKLISTDKLPITKAAMEELKK